MIIKIKGKQGCGKTTTAARIVNTESFVAVYAMNLASKEWLCEVKELMPEYLVVREVKSLKKVEKWLKKGGFRVRQPHQEKGTPVKLPPVIILIKQS